MSQSSEFDPLAPALSTAQAKYTRGNSRSLKAHENACHDFPGGNTRTVLWSSPFPITFVGGKGCELTSLDGNVYVDFLGEYSAGIYGHSNEPISAAVMEAMKKGWNFGGPNMYERELARKVTQRFAPSGVELVRFTNSGTEANTTALAAAVAFTGRKTIITFSNGYHGGTLTFHSPPAKTNVNLPHDFIVAPFNDIEGTQKIISSLPKDTLAAIIVEPIQGSGGCIVGSQFFLQFLNHEAHRLGALFIVDEVMTSRLSYHGYSASLGLRPDLVTLGKWVGGGMTFGAFGGRKDGGVMSMFDPRDGVLSHSGTFNNNVVTMAAGCKGMDVYTREEVEKLNALGEGLKSAIEAVIKKHGIAESKSQADVEKNELECPFTGQTEDNSEMPDQRPRMSISGKGSMLAIHFSGESGDSLLALFWHHMLDNGIYLAPRGFMALNLELRQKHVDEFVAATEEFVVKFKQALVQSRN